MSRPAEYRRITFESGITSEDTVKVLKAAELLEEVTVLLHEASDKGKVLADTVYDLYRRAFNLHFEVQHEAKVMWNHDHGQ